MKKTIMRFLSLVLCATMLFGTFQVPAMAAVDDPIAGETGSGWSEVGVMPGEQEDHSPPVSDSGTGEIVSPGESEEEQSSSSGPARSSFRRRRRGTDAANGRKQFFHR